MLIITLPDNSKKSYKKPVTSFQIANDISTKLASEAFVSYVNGELWDLARLIETDSIVSILTKKMKKFLKLSDMMPPILWQRLFLNCILILKLQ